MLVQARISLIPTRPGSDWRDLPNIIWQFPDGTQTGKFKIYPVIDSAMYIFDFYWNYLLLLPPVSTN